MPEEKHIQPTKEDLLKEQQRIEKELDNPQPSPSAPSTPPSETPPSASPSAPPPPSASPSEPPSPSAPPPSPSPSAPPPSPSKEAYKEKFKQSTREALVQKLGRDTMASAIKSADELHEPTEEEMKQEYGEDWDVMSDMEKRDKKRLVMSDRRWEIITKANKESEDLNAWLKKVEDFALSPKTLVDHPELEGKEESFRSFAITPSRRGLPLDDLLKVFLFDAVKAPPRKKGQMFERPGGGDGTKGEQVDKFDPAEAEKLKNTDWDKYRAYLKKHEKAVKAGEIGV